MDASMMMSQRPSGGSNNSNNHSSKPSGQSSSTIGKFKGVMLCNRPNRGPAQASNSVNKSAGTGKTVPFRAGGHNPIQNDLGLSRAKPVRHAAPRKKVVTATQKHKQWLANFTAEKLRLEADMEQTALQKEKKRKAFMIRERKLRNAILDEVKEKEEAQAKKNGERQRQEVPQTGSVGSSRDAELEELLKFTQDINAEDFDEQMEKMLDEEDDELDWVDNMIERGEVDDPVEFDPESDENELVHPDTGMGGYDGDDAISRKEWRVRMVETVDPENGEPSDSDDAISRRDYLTAQGMDVQRVYAGDARQRAAAEGGGMIGLSEEALKQWNQRSGADASTAKPVEDDALSTASALLSDSRKMRSVHSARSVAAVAKQRKGSSFKLPEIREVPAPKIVTLDEKRLDYQPWGAAGQHPH